MLKLLVFGWVLCVDNAAAQTASHPPHEDILKQWGINTDASAQDPVAPPLPTIASTPCWTISRPQSGTTIAVILLNQCNGVTYVLGSSDQKGGFVWEWHPVNVSGAPAVFRAN